MSAKKVKPNAKKGKARLLMAPCSDSSEDEVDVTPTKRTKQRKDKARLKSTKRKFVEESAESESDEDIEAFTEQFVKKSKSTQQIDDEDEETDEDEEEEDSEEEDAKLTGLSAKEKADIERARRRMSPPSGSGSEEEESEEEEEEEEEDAGEEEEEEEEGDKTPFQKSLEQFQSDLKDVPFEDLQRLKQKVGLKAFNSLMAGNSSQAEPKSFLRADKNKPMELTSKKPVSRFREVLPVKKKKVRDPRFDDLCGTYDETFFKNSFSFIEDIRLREKQELQKQLTETKDKEEKEKIKYLLNRMTQQDMAEKKKEKSVDIKRKVREQEKTLVQDGKLPFHLKKSERKKLELAEQYRELKKSGKLEKYLTKKRKKNARKEKKKMPYQQ